MRVRRATHQGTLCHIIRSALPKMESLQEEQRGTKRHRPTGEKPLMTQEQLDRFAQGYSYERYVRGLTGQRVVLSPRPWLTERARGARLAPRPPVEQPPAHLLRMQHQDKGGNDNVREASSRVQCVPILRGRPADTCDLCPVSVASGRVLRTGHCTTGCGRVSELPEGDPRWNNLPPHLDGLQGDTQEKSCSML